jgi:hypothetical protein
MTSHSSRSKKPIVSSSINSKLSLENSVQDFENREGSIVVDLQLCKGCSS